MKKTMTLFFEKKVYYFVTVINMDTKSVIEIFTERLYEVSYDKNYETIFENKAGA